MEEAAAAVPAAACSTTWAVLHCRCHRVAAAMGPVLPELPGDGHGQAGGGGRCNPGPLLPPPSPRLEASLEAVARQSPGLNTIKK